MIKEITKKTISSPIQTLLSV